MSSVETGPEGSNPSLSAINTERPALGVVMPIGDALEVLDRNTRVS